MKLEEHFSTQCWIPAKRKDVFTFFCNPKNLERMTPPWLHFKMTNQTTSEVGKDTEFTYKLKIHGVPIRWTSRIESWQPESEFSDIQLSGPYSKWFHMHRFKDQDGGTLMLDDVTYQPPGGWLGKILAGPFIRRDIKTIFEFRERTIKQVFQ